MDTRERQILKEVLGRIGDETPDPMPFDDLDVLDVRPTNPKPHSLTTWMAAAAVAVIAVGVIVFASTTPQGPVASTTDSLFWEPSYVPEGLTLAEAAMSAADGFSTPNPDEAIASNMTYLPPGQSTWIEGDRALIIDSEDLIAQIEALLARDELECIDTINGENAAIDPETCRNQIESSQCSGLEAIEAGSLNTAQCAREFADSYRNLGATVEETTVRGKPAVLIEQSNTVSGIDHYSYTVIVFEGGPVITAVTGHQLKPDVVLQVAQGLRPATPAEFIAHSG